MGRLINLAHSEFGVFKRGIPVVEGIQKYSHRDPCALSCRVLVMVWLMGEIMSSFGREISVSILILGARNENRGSYKSGNFVITACLRRELYFLECFGCAVGPTAAIGMHFAKRYLTVQRDQAYIPAGVSGSASS